MKFSEQWLRSWVNPDLGTDALAAQLTLLGLEVEAVTPAAAPFTKVCVGEILTALPHPDADRLQVCSVSVGKAAPLQIVCGAKNACAGLKVAVAQVGALLPGDFNIKKSQLRGVMSEGMLCSASELGLAASSEGIMALPASAPLGEDLRAYMALEDVCIDIALTPNRGDCLSIRGIAREIAAANDLSLTPHPVKEPVWDSGLPTVAVTIEDRDDCPHYCGVIVQLDAPVEARETPMQIAERLRRSGLRLVNPVVDACNYIMLEMGQPMHAFDADHLKGAITVKRAKAGDSVHLLNDTTCSLQDGTLVVCDEQGIQAIAGVMGGKASAVTGSTRTLFIESALFSPVTLGLFSRPLGIHSDAQHRFERGVDPEGQAEALTRVVQQLLHQYGGRVGRVTSSPETFKNKPLSLLLREKQILRHLGVAVPASVVETGFPRLGLQLQPCEGGWHVAVPAFRSDITREMDLIEEVARLYGYDNIPVLPEKRTVQPHVGSGDRIPMHDVRLYMQSRGFHDCIHYSFVSQASLAPFLDGVVPLALSHPLSTDMAVMRTTLIPGLLSTAAFNFNRQAKSLRLYELGRCFLPSKQGHTEPVRFAMLLAGDMAPQQWGCPSRRVDFYDLKGELEAWLKPHHTKMAFQRAVMPGLHPGRTAQLLLDDVAVGYLGEVHPTVLAQFGIDHPVYVAELDLRPCLATRQPAFSAFSAFPAVRRDLAFVMDEQIEAQAVTDWIKKHCGELLVEIGVFDVYQGKNCQKGKKSMALGLTFQDVSRTLVDDEINQLIQGVVEGVQREFRAELRT